MSPRAWTRSLAVLSLSVGLFSCGGGLHGPDILCGCGGPCDALSDAEVTDAVKKLVEVYKANARPFERMGEMIERIGWPKFFKLSGLEFTKYHIDDFTHAGESFSRSAHIRQSSES